MYDKYIEKLNKFVYTSCWYIRETSLKNRI